MKYWYNFRQISDSFRKRKALVLTIIIITIITVIVFRQYLFHVLPLGSDSMGLVSEVAMKKSLSSFFSSWNPVSELGHLTYPATFLELTLYGGVVVLGLPSGIVIMAISAGSFWVSGMTMWWCAAKITKNQYGALAAALVYLFSQVSLSQYTEGHLTFVIGYAILPLVIMFCWMTVEKLRVRNAVLLLLSCIVLGSVSAPHFAFISVFLILSFGIPYFLLRRPAIRNIVPIVLSVPMILVPTVFGLVFGNSYGLSSSFSVDDAFSYSSHSIMDAFALKATETSSALNGSSIFSTSNNLILVLFIFLAAILPCLAFLPILKKNGKYRFIVISLSISILASIFLSKGPNPPFSGLFDWSFTNIPMLDSMRVFSRFLLINAFSYGILIAILIADPPNIHLNIFRWKSTTAYKALPVIIIAIVVMTPSSAIFSDAIGSFDLPPVYERPLDWISTQSGDYRIITLPYGYAYYPIGLDRLDGYPNSNTLDVGSYSPLITGHELANSPTDPFWIYLGTAIDNKVYGYKDAPQILGEVGSVKYVVCQAYASPEQIKNYESLNGLQPIISFEGNATILQNEYYKERVNLLSNTTTIVGGLGAILPAIQMGTLDLNKYAPVSATGAFTNTTLSEWLNLSPSIILENGDFLNFVIESHGWPSGSLIQLSPYGIRTTDDLSKGWVFSQDNILKGISDQSGIATSADATISLSYFAEKAGWYDILLKQEYSEANGNLTLKVNNNLTTNLRNVAASPTMKWTDFGEVWLNKGDNQIDLRNMGNGQNNLEDLLVTNKTSLDKLTNETMNNITASKTQMTYMINGVDLLNSRNSDWRLGLLENGTAAVRDVIFQPWNEGMGQLVSDKLSIYNATSNITQSGSNLARLARFGTLSTGTEYELKVDARTDVDINGQVARLSLRSGDVEIANLSLMGNRLSQNSYNTITFRFSVNEGSNGNLSIDCNTLNSSSGLKIDWMEISPADQHTIATRVYLPIGQSTISVFEDGLRNSPSGVSIQIDGKPQKLIDQDNDGRYTFQVESTYTGYHVLSVDAHSIYEISVDINAQNGNSSAQGSATYQMKSVTDYVVHTNSSQQSILAISESYHEYWKAYADGVELKHIELYSKINGFIVPAGNHTITIVFEGNDIYDISLVLTLSYFIACTAIFWKLSKRGRRGPYSGP